MSREDLLARIERLEEQLDEAGVQMRWYTNVHDPTHEGVERGAAWIRALDDRMFSLRRQLRQATALTQEWPGCS